jgi:hypothetical protein
LQTRRLVTSAQENVPGVHTHGAHAPAEQLVLPGQVVSKVPSPSDRHCRTTVVLAQLVEPGVQSHARQALIEGSQLEPVPQATPAPQLSPSAAQVCSDVVPRHLRAPGLHSRRTQLAVELALVHESVEAHGVEVQESPLSAQVSRPSSVVPVQRLVVGLHTQGRHAPASQPSIASHGRLT